MWKCKCTTNLHHNFSIIYFRTNDGHFYTRNKIWINIFRTRKVWTEKKKSHLTFCTRIICNGIDNGFTAWRKYKLEHHLWEDKHNWIHFNNWTYVRCCTPYNFELEPIQNCFQMFFVCVLNVHINQRYWALNLNIHCNWKECRSDPIVNIPKRDWIYREKPQMKKAL